MSSAAGKVLFSTTQNLDQFSGSRASDVWALSHLTTYTSPSDSPLPTDHGLLFRTGKQYRVAIADGLGHHDPEEIGAVAAAVIDELVHSSLLSEQGEESYRNYLKQLATKYRQGEGTTLIQAEVIRLNEEEVGLTVGQCGDSDVLLLNGEGEVLYSTVDKKSALKPDGREIGLLAIGANFDPEWLDDATYEKFKIRVKDAFLIVCSDGLTEPLRKKEGSIDRDRFRYAAMTGRAALFGEEVPPPSLVKLTASLLVANLTEAAKEFARRISEGNGKPAGDDTTIIVLDLSKLSSEEPCSIQ